MNIKDLTAEQREELLRELENEKKREEEEKRAKIEEYKKLVADTTVASFKELQDISSKIREIKKRVFDNFQSILELKEELYGVKENQQSHTFTADGVTVTLGRRVVDNYDDTVHVGIEKAKKYISTLTAGQVEEIETILELLLRKDKKGNLKASRVLELDKLAEKIDNVDFKEGVKIIKDSYTPQKTAYFLEAYYKDEAGIKRSIPLSFTSVDL